MIALPETARALVQSGRLAHVVTLAMIDRLVHHADVASLRGDTYRVKDRDLGRVPMAGKIND